MIADLTAKIDLLKSMRNPFPDFRREPSLEEIEARGLAWYWEEWREDADIPDDEEAEDA